MATVNSIIKLALKDAGVIGGRETPSSDEADDALATLNQMLAMWRTETLSVYCMKQLSVAMDGSEAYTIGSGGDFNVDRPVSIEGAFWRAAGTQTDYNLRIVHSYLDYQSLAQKTLTGDPCIIYYRPAFPLAEVYIWPQPVGGTLYITVKQEMPQYSTIQDDVDLPPEYEGAIRWNLAAMLCATFGMPLTAEINRYARQTKRALKINNSSIKTMRMPGVVMQDSRYNVYTDE